MSPIVLFPRCIRLPVTAVLLALFPGLASAQFALEGLADRQTYTDSVQFRLVPAAGFSCYALLDGREEIPVNVNRAVTSVDYHELSITCTNTVSGAVTNALVRFVVRSSERGGTETGLAPWTPLPTIPSTAEEAAGAHLRLVVPRVFPAGLPLPLVAWVEDDGGRAVRVNGRLTSQGLPPIEVRRGVGSGFVPGTNASFTASWSLAGLRAERAVSVESNVVWTRIGGQVDSDQRWPAGARIQVTNHLVLAANSTLTIEPGALVLLEPGVNIGVSGVLQIQGSDVDPVTFAPANPARPWGGFFLTNSSARIVANYAIFTGSGADPNGVPNSHRHEQALFYVDQHANLSLTNCAAIDLAGQFGHATDRGLPYNRIEIVRSLVQRCITGGEYNGASVLFLDSALIECPYATPQFNDGDEDGLYFTHGEFVVENSLIGWTRDDGIDAGSGSDGSVLVRNTWVEATYHEGFAWSGGNRRTTNDHTVSINCGQGIECGWSSTPDSPVDYVQDCLVVACGIGARFGDNYDWDYNGRLTVTNSLLLNNRRDIWGMTWDDWLYHTNAMDLRSNWLTSTDPRHPDNRVWNPATDGSRLAAFMTTPATASVGVGLALWTNQIAGTQSNLVVPVGLSSFTARPVSVHYRIEGGEPLGGTLTFLPGETARTLSVSPDASGALRRISLHPGTNAEVTGISYAWLLPPSSNAGVVLVPAGAVWRYDDQGTNAGTAWREPIFDDAAWPSGPAELGYGDAKDGRPETTVIGFGPDPARRHISYYFRHRFEVPDPASIGGLKLSLKRDDGAAVYLNGNEIFRSNLPDGPIGPDTEADLADDDGAQFFTTSLPPSALVAGQNLIAVEVHQESPGSSDVSFDLELRANPAPSLQLLRFGDEWFLFWPEAATELESAPNLAGPWVKLAGPSPLQVMPVETSRFYRLRSL